MRIMALSNDTPHTVECRLDPADAQVLQTEIESYTRGREAHLALVHHLAELIGGCALEETHINKHPAVANLWGLDIEGDYYGGDRTGLPSVPTSLHAMHKIAQRALNEYDSGLVRFSRLLGEDPEVPDSDFELLGDQFGPIIALADCDSRPFGSISLDTAVTFRSAGHDTRLLGPKRIIRPFFIIPKSLQVVGTVGRIGEEVGTPAFGIITQCRKEWQSAQVELIETESFWGEGDDPQDISYNFLWRYLNRAREALHSA